MTSGILLTPIVACPVTVRSLSIVTLSGSPTVTVPFVRETSTSFDVPLIARTAPLTELPSVTLPDDTEKSLASNFAIPLFDELASSPAISIWLFDTDVLIPSPAAKVIVSPSVTGSGVPLSAVIVNAVPVDVIAPVIVTSPVTFRGPTIFVESRCWWYY